MYVQHIVNLNTKKRLGITYGCLCLVEPDLQKKINTEPVKKVQNTVLQ